MEISFPSHHCWSKPIPERHIELFGENARRKLRTTAEMAAARYVTTNVSPLDEATLEWFIPMYESRMKQKQSPRIFNVRETTLANPDRHKLYYALSLFEGGTPLGATIFSLYKQTLSIAYRTYSLTWQRANLPASPSLFAEWAIADFAATQGCKRIIHGRNRNPYGMFSSIGLAIYKLSVGCIPKTSKKFTLLQSDTSSFTQDTLVLLEPKDGTRRISAGCLIVAEANYPLYEQVTKYPGRLQVDVLFRT